MSERTKKKKRTPNKRTTTTVRCRYSSFDHPKHHEQQHRAGAFFPEFVPTFLSSIELFAFTKKKNETNDESAVKTTIRSVDALDREFFSVIRKCTMADVLNAHFVHEYVKEEEGEKKNKALSLLSIGGEEGEEDVFSIARGRFEAILSESLCERLGVSGPLSLSSSSSRGGEEERRRRVVAMNLRSDNFAPGRTTHDRVTDNARRIFHRQSSGEKSGNAGVNSTVLLAHFEVGNEAKEVERSSFAEGESAVEISIRNIEKCTGELECGEEENTLCALVESFLRSVESKESAAMTTSGEHEETLRRILEMVSVAALRNRHIEKEKEAKRESSSIRRLQTARWSGFLTSKHLERTLKATNEMIKKDDEFECCFVFAHAFPNQPSCESLRATTRTMRKNSSNRKRKKSSSSAEKEKGEEEKEEEEEVEILTPRTCAFLLMRNQRYVSFLPIA